jgi:hypothetical protein
MACIYTTMHIQDASSPFHTRFDDFSSFGLLAGHSPPHNGCPTPD